MKLLRILGVVCVLITSWAAAKEPTDITLLDTTSTSLDSLYLAVNSNLSNFSDFHGFTDYEYVAPANQLNEFDKMIFDSTVSDLKSAFYDSDKAVHRKIPDRDLLVVQPYDFADGSYIIEQSPTRISNIVIDSQGAYRLNTNLITQRFPQSSEDCRLNGVHIVAACDEHRRFNLRIPDATKAKQFRAAIDEGRYIMLPIVTVSKIGTEYSGPRETEIYRSLVLIKGREEIDEKYRKTAQFGMPSNRYEFGFGLQLKLQLVAFRIVDKETNRIISEWARSDSYRSSSTFNPKLFISQTQRNPNINRVDEQGDALIHRILNTRETDPMGRIESFRLGQPLDKQSLDTLELALLQGADPNQTGFQGKTPLHWACQRRDRAAIDLLLQHGADPNIKDGDGQTAFYQAVCSNADTTILAVLVGHGADLNATAKSTMRMLGLDLPSRLDTPLRAAVKAYCGRVTNEQAATESMRTIDFLLQHGASPRMSDAQVQKYREVGGELLRSVMDDVLEELADEPRLSPEERNPARVKNLSALLSLLDLHACSPPSANQTNSQPSKGIIGIAAVAATPYYLKESNLDPSTRALIIISVTDKGPAARSGIRQGDVIHTFNGETVSCLNDLRNRLNTVSPGEKVRLEGWHRETSTDYIETTTGALREKQVIKAKPFAASVKIMERPSDSLPATESRSPAAAESGPDSEIQRCTAILQSAHADRQGVTQAYADRAVAYEARGEWQNAIADWSMVIAEIPSYGPTWARRGQCQIYQGQLDAAKRDFDKAVELDYMDLGGVRKPLQTSSIYSGRGILRLLTGEFASANEDFQFTRTDDPNAGYFYLYKVVCSLRQGDASGARTLLNNMPPSLLYNEWIADLQQFLLDRISTEELLSLAAKQAKPNDAQCESLYYIGIRDLASGNTKQAQQYFEQCLATGQDQLTEYMLAKSELARIKP